MNIEALNNDIKMFNKKIWLSEDNRNLLNLVKEGRIKLAPATIYVLDQDGFNYLEIISLAECAGKVIHKLPTGDVDFLNLIQEKFGYVFGAEQKFKNKYLRSKVDHFYSKMNEKGDYLRSTAILTTDKLYA